MRNWLYRTILANFKRKPSCELRKIVNQTHTGEWSEEAVSAATSLLLQRHGWKYVSDHRTDCDAGQPDTQSGNEDRTRRKINPIELGFWFFGVTLAMQFVPTPGSWSDGGSQWMPELLFVIATPVFLFLVVRLVPRGGNKR